MGGKINNGVLKGSNKIVELKIIKMKSLIVTFIFPFFSITSFSQTQMEMNTQAAVEYNKADKKLTVVYKELMTFLSSKEQKDILIKAERAWINFRDNYANYKESYYEGGSIQPMIYLEALTEVTEAR